MKKNKLSLFIFLCVYTFHQNAIAQIRLPAIISDHMLLQQKSEITLWGWCSPAEPIAVKAEWDTTTYRTTGSNGARWQLKIKTPVSGGPYKINLQGYNNIIIHDVMIGEVWICSGQSNMEANAMPGGLMIKQLAEEAPHAANNYIRFFYIPKSTATYPQDDVQAHWDVCDSNTIKKMSAVGYFFGKEINKILQVPVGLINANWGGSPAEVWTPAEIVEQDTSLYAAAKKQWVTEWWPTESGSAFNAMINPVTRFNIAGAIWYQGESNASTWYTYEQLFSAMIGSWRKAWQKNFPFYFVQIAPFHYGEKNVRALLCEQQSKTLGLPNTGMAVISDLVEDTNNIHPQNKKEVGMRLAKLALSETYQKNTGVYKSPMYKSFSVNRDRILISFDNAPTILESRNGSPTGFFIAGSDKNFLPANAVIKGNQIEVWNKQIKNPVAVRYNFSNTAIPNVFSKEGFPLCLFRTDNWEVDTSALK
ncbi:MAG TPA: sialate O-acetylesterase [Puia sp.]|nr:sialate O-acetylesterase [Puia sp.]